MYNSVEKINQSKFIFKINILCFNDTIYRQEKGTDMGTKFALVYATLTIGYLEETLYTIIETNYDKEFQRYLKNI